MNVGMAAIIPNNLFMFVLLFCFAFLHHNLVSLEGSTFQGRKASTRYYIYNIIKLIVETVHWVHMDRKCK